MVEVPKVEVPKVDFDERRFSTLIGDAVRPALATPPIVVEMPQPVAPMAMSRSSFRHGDESPTVNVKVVNQPGQTAEVTETQRGSVRDIEVVIVKEVTKNIRDRGEVFQALSQKSRGPTR
jgi:hypothetical protein